MSESGDRKAGTTGVPPQPDPAAEAEDYGDLARTQSNESDASRYASHARESDMTLIMNRARQERAQVGALPPPQLPPFRLPAVEPPPTVSIMDQAEVDLIRTPSGLAPRPEHSTTQAGIELGRPLFAVAAIGGVLALGAFFITGRNAAMGVGIGALTATLNLWIFTRIGRASVTGRHRRGWGFIAALKLILLFGGVFLILRSESASPLTFLVGYLALPIGIVASQFLGLPADFENGEGSV